MVSVSAEINIYPGDGRDGFLSSAGRSRFKLSKHRHETQLWRSYNKNVALLFSTSILRRSNVLVNKLITHRFKQ